MNRFMLEHWVRSVSWLKGHSRLWVIELHLEICVVSKRRVNRVNWVLHRLIQVYKLNVLVWIKPRWKDMVGTLINVVIKGEARGRGSR
ncbi:hypothetical protein HanRHA438_Chr15g0734211 [Helianthus annuus]|nr:hypothetical protein HanRHA438_Chr15g0734211 [Helianthus annuus]